MQSLLSVFGLGVGNPVFPITKLPEYDCHRSLDHILCSKTVSSENQWLYANSAELSILYFWRHRRNGIFGTVKNPSNMFQENLPPSQKSLESVSVPTACLGLQHLLLGLLQHFLTSDLSLFSSCRNGYFKKPDRLVPVCFFCLHCSMLLHSYGFQYKGHSAK